MEAEAGAGPSVGWTGFSSMHRTAMNYPVGYAPVLLIRGTFPQ